MRPKFGFILFTLLLLIGCKKDKLDETTEFQTGLLQTPATRLANVSAASPPPGSGGGLTAYDLSQFMPPVRSQGNQGSCASWATGYYLKSYHEHRDQNSVYGTGNDFSGVFSPAFLYNSVKVSNCNGGSYIIDNLERIKQVGICNWNEMPYDATDCSTNPNQTAIDDAVCGKISSHFLIHSSINTNYELPSNLLVFYTKEWISRDEPVVIGIPLDQNFQNASPLTNGEYIYKNYSQSSHVGHHAVLVVGYDDSKNAFKAINSWGTNWANNGYFWFDYSLFGDIVWEAWKTRDLVNDPLCEPNSCDNWSITCSFPQIPTTIPSYPYFYQFQPTSCNRQILGYSYQPYISNTYPMGNGIYFNAPGTYEVYFSDSNNCYSAPVTFELK